ncbi:MAG: hypothetical protein RLZZ142_2383 [Verrucomicrobiota bacterium]|jgi:hypothetical protein
MQSPLNRVLPLIFLLCGTLEHASAVPTIFHASDPVRPNETVLVTGDSFGEGATVELAPIPAEAAALGDAGQLSQIAGWMTIDPVQRGERALKFVVPQQWVQGAWVCRVRCAGEVSLPVILNRPSVWWWNGDMGETASPGGWIRAFGKALSFGTEGRAKLVGKDNGSIALRSMESSGYALKFGVPDDVAEGEYDLWVHNGIGGEATWGEVGRVQIRAARAWAEPTFNIRDFGPKPAEALEAALEKARVVGGGTVFLPRGRYFVRSTLRIPPNTVLRGESMDSVSVCWPDFEAPPTELITGKNYALENLTLYCQDHKNVVTDSPDSEHVALRRVRIRANCYFAIEEVHKEFRKRRGPESHMKCGAAVELKGKNFEVTDCDIYASNKGIRLLKAKTGIIARNTIRYGGRGYNIENADRLIFEQNRVEGNNLVSIGNDMTTFWSSYCRHIYFAHNQLRQMYGADREMMTLDAAGGAYFGTLALVSGTALTLAADPDYRDYAPKPHTDWTGSVVQILAGKGAGQYRFVVANSGRDWRVDRPWTLDPDVESLVAIAPFRGRCLYIGNECEDGGPFQLYGAAHESILAENRASRMDGFFVQGLNPHGWGYQPSWFCQVLDNEILVGNGYGGREGRIGAGAGDETRAFSGPLVYGSIIRRNKLHNQSGISVSGNTAETVLEHNEIRDTELGIVIQKSTAGNFLRENRFERVTTPIRDESGKTGQ